MSTAAGRAEITAALSTVDGITVYDKRPFAPRAGDCYLRWRSERADEGVGFDRTWLICIVTPQGEAAADAWIDQREDALLAALRRAVYVTGYGPANLGTDASPVDGLLITSNRE